MLHYKVQNKLNRLKVQARESAQWRGHTLSHFKTEDANRATATCKVCGRYVQVNANPAPNEINIGGDAVALNCKG